METVQAGFYILAGKAFPSPSLPDFLIVVWKKIEFRSEAISWRIVVALAC